MRTGEKKGGIAMEAMQARVTGAVMCSESPKQTGRPESKSCAKMRSARGIAENVLGTLRRTKKSSRNRS